MLVDVNFQSSSTSPTISYAQKVRAQFNFHIEILQFIHDFIFYIFFLIIMDAFAPGWVIFDIRQGIFFCNVCRQRNIFSSSCLWQSEDLSICSQFIQSWCESTSWRKSEIDQGTLACSCSIKTLACSKKMPAAHN